MPSLFFVGGSNGRFPLSYSIDCASSLMFMQGMASPSFPHPPQPPVSPDVSVWFGTQTVPQDRVSHKQVGNAVLWEQPHRGMGCLLITVGYCIRSNTVSPNWGCSKDLFSLLGFFFSYPFIIHSFPFTFLIQVCGGGGASPSCHWMTGRIHPRLVIRLSQG